jgi:hypothetical protein
MSVLIKNNASSRLASSLAVGGTSFAVSAGEGAKFPVCAPPDWFPVTVINSAGEMEIMRCTSRSGDVLTVVRASEGTAARAFSPGDRVELRITQAVMAEFLQNADSRLGSAAWVNAQASVGDTTAGSLMRLGAFGWGTETLETASSIHSYRTSARLFTPETTDVAATGLQYGTMVTFAFEVPSFRAAQLFFSQIPSNKIMFRVGDFRSAPILELWHTGNFNPAVKVTGDYSTVMGLSGNNLSVPYMRRDSDGAICWLQPALNFTPVQQGGGAYQTNDKVYLGYNGSTAVRVQVGGSFDMGDILTDSNSKEKIRQRLVDFNTGEIGTYAFLRNNTGGNVNPGGTYSGANLIYGSSYPGDGGLSPGGVWRCMGAASVNQVTLFLRIS